MLNRFFQLALLPFGFLTIDGILRIFSPINKLPIRSSHTLPQQWLQDVVGRVENRPDEPAAFLTAPALTEQSSLEASGEKPRQRHARKYKVDRIQGWLGLHGLQRMLYSKLAVAPL